MREAKFSSQKPANNTVYSFEDKGYLITTMA